MNSSSGPEHYVTLFDRYYLPLGLCLYRSLEAHGRPFRLWIVAMDDACADALASLELRDAVVLRLAEVENAALRAVRPGRTVGEYCWTLTPFLPSAVLERAPGAARVTYLDADVFFFANPAPLFQELAASGKHVLITEHAFAPEYAEKIRYGRYCVQFVTVRNTPEAARVLRWWQDRCIEWCYDREERGLFGDQKYLEDWPTRFGDAVHVVAQTNRTLAPWNVAHVERSQGHVDPIFYHFHHLKIVSSHRVVLYHSYRVGGRNKWIYDRYASELRAVTSEMRQRGLPVLGRRAIPGTRGALKLVWHLLRRRAAMASL